MINYTSPSKTASNPLTQSGLYVGNVTRSDSGGVFVTIPQIVPDFAFGPCLRIAGGVSGVTYDGEASSTIEVGTKVLCGFLNNQFDEVVILGEVL
jgi:hypothetical protein